MLDDPEDRRRTQSGLARAVARAALAMLAAHDHFNRLQEVGVLRGRCDPDPGPQRDALTAAARAWRAARARARFARTLWWAWQAEYGQADKHGASMSTSAPVETARASGEPLQPAEDDARALAHDVDQLLLEAAALLALVEEQRPPQ